MLDYYLLFFFLAGTCSLETLVLKKKSKWGILWGVLLPMVVLFVGGRYYCDNDFVNYALFYTETPPLYDTSIAELFQLYLFWQVEPGYILSSSFLNAFGFGFQIIFLFCALLTFGLISRFLWHVSDYPLTSFALFFATFFSLPFMQMRFGVAAACVCYALLQLDNGNKRGFWIWQIIGLTFHLTAIVGIFIRLIYRIRLSRKQSVYVILFSFLCSFIPTKAIFLLVVTSLGLGRYQMYFNDTAGSYSSLIFLIVLLLPFIYFEPQLRVKVRYYDLLLLLGLSSVLIGCVTREVPILNRFYLLLSISYCAILPSYFHLFKRNASYLIVWSLLMAYAFLKFLPSMNYVQPYKNFLFE